MAQYDIPITVFLKDLASDAMGKVGASAKKAQKIVAKFGSVGGAALNKFAVAATGLNQGLELFKKGVEVFRSFTEKSREYRDENDKLIASFDKNNELIGSLAARIGDVLINAFNAAVTALKPLIKSARDFFVENQKIIGLKLVEYFRDFALLMVGGVAKSIVGVTRIVTFFALAWEAIKLSVNTTVGAMLSGIASILETAAEAADYLPGVGDELAASFETAAKAARGLGDEFENSGEKGKKEIEKLLDDQALLEQQIKDVETSIKTGIGTVAVAAMNGLSEATSGANEKLKDTKEETKETTKETKKLSTELEKAHQQNLSFAQSLGGLYQTLGNSFGQTFSAIVTGTEKTGELFSAFLGNALTATVQFARDTIINMQLAAMANAAVGASFGGPLAIIAATAVVAGIFEGLLAKMPGMADGGMVRGGTAGQDSVPAMLMPGEYVMNTNQVEAMRQMFSNMDGVNSTGHFANGGTVGGASSLGGVNITIKSEALPNKTEVAKYVRSTIMPAMRDLQAQGAI